MRILIRSSIPKIRKDISKAIAENCFQESRNEKGADIIISTESLKINDLSKNKPWILITEDETRRKSLTNYINVFVLKNLEELKVFLDLLHRTRDISPDLLEKALGIKIFLENTRS